MGVYFKGKKMDEVTPVLKFDSDRRFGAEFEYCSFDNRDFKKHPLNQDNGELPEGIHDISTLLMEKMKVQVAVNKWHTTHNNPHWVLKPDSSAGIEVCSPVVKGWHGVKTICQAVDVMTSDPRVHVDDRCGFHVHVEVADCDVQRLACILAYWVKCEAIFLDSVPRSRKRNKYCQQIGLSPYFQHDTCFDATWLVETLGQMKYYSINNLYYKTGKRKTIEFRIVEGEGCMDSYLMKNWLRLLIHFVEMTKDMEPPPKPKLHDPWTGFFWLDLKDVVKVLKFDQNISKGLTETRNWFLARIAKNAVCDLSGLWCPEARQVTLKQLEELSKELDLPQVDAILKPKDLQTALYSPEYIV